MTTVATLNPDIFDTAITYLNSGPEVQAKWVAEHAGTFDFIDVREPHELEGLLGAADGVANIPLAEFLATVAMRDLERPTVLICRSGRRSALAAKEALSAGMKHVASVEGGMLAWNRDVLNKQNVHAEEHAANTQILNEAVITTNGVPEVTVDWVAQNLGHFRLIDVRMAEELAGPLGRVVQSEHVPLGTLVEAAQTWDKTTPIVVMCKSGGRSARGAMALIHSGFTNIASMEGGMMGWAAAGLKRIQTPIAA